MFSFALRFVRDSEVFVSSFEFEFLFRVCRRSSNSSFSFRCSIRFLEFRFSIRVSSSSSLNFRVEFRIRVFRFVALFDFSNLILNSSSNSTSRISCRISNSNLSSKFVVEIFVSLRYLISRISLLYSTSRISTSRVKCLEFRIRLFVSNLSSNFEFVLIYSTSRTSIRIVVEIVVCESNS